MVRLTNLWRRWALMALGCVCVALGILGVVLPVLPTTPFLLVAVWAFARSSEHLHTWLVHHPWLGRPVRDWEHHRVIPIRAKVIALSTMTVSMTWVLFFSSAPWYALATMAAVMSYGAWFILSKPSRPPSAS